MPRIGQGHDPRIAFRSQDAAARLRTGERIVAGSPARWHGTASPPTGAPTEGPAPRPTWRDVTREWLPVLAALAITRSEAQAAAERALANRTSFPRELLASGRVDEHRLFCAVADALGLPFMARIEPSQLMMRERHRLAILRGEIVPFVAVAGPPGVELAYVVADPDIGLAALKARLDAQPGLRGRLLVAPPSVLRAAVLAGTRWRLLFDACFDLFVRRPRFSARVVGSAWQGLCVGVITIVLPLGLVLAPSRTFLAIHLFATLLFFMCITLRLLALERARPLRLPPLPPHDPGELPGYSVLVALYREREVVPQLLVALGKLEWPQSKLEIKLVCEADDHETLEALRACPLRPCVEIIAVPPGGPRTKPKALCYALPLCRGELIALYDAEDCPHPRQLLEAWHRFRAEGPQLACLQAPLVVTNAQAGPLQRMFAFEYAGLFRGLLPWLALQGLMFPLGGTSNHFRHSALLAAGGWDAHNVTGDADLGLRLTRLGYRLGVISYPTFEEAPETLRVWLPQRVRWFKGWAVTWLVHMRNPRRLWRDLGVASFLVSQVLFLGMLLSAMIHPLCIGTVVFMAAKLATHGVLHIREVALTAISLINIAFGYGAFLAIGCATLSERERRQFWKVVLLTPVHWMLLSLAAWWAVWELWRRPHHWAKTPHSRRKRPAATEDQRSAEDGSPMILGSSAPMASVSRPS